MLDHALPQAEIDPLGLGEGRRAVLADQQFRQVRQRFDGLDARFGGRAGRVAGQPHGV